MDQGSLSEFHKPSQDPKTKGYIPEPSESWELFDLMTVGPNI